MLRIILKYLLYFLLVYYLFRMVDKALFGDRKAMEKERKRQEKEKDRLFRQYKRKEGSVTIDPGKGPQKKFDKDEGDYVDYEEIK
jgi:hypothetical protein